MTPDSLNVSPIKTPVNPAVSANAVNTSGKASFTFKNPSFRAILAQEALARMSRAVPFSATDVTALGAMYRVARDFSLGVDVRRAGDVIMPGLILSGWVGHYYDLEDGRRQFVRVSMPGDFVGCPLFPDMPMLCSVTAFTPVVLASAEVLCRAVRVNPDSPMARAARNAGYASAMQNHNPLLRLGVYSSYERMVHFMLEIWHRVNEATESMFAFPLIQNHISNLIGISTVQINRTIKRIEKNGLFTIKRGWVTIHKPTAMRDLVAWTEAPPLRGALLTQVMTG